LQSRFGGQDEIGIPDELKVKKGSYEAICNPSCKRIAHEQKTDLNVIVGLCVGMIRCSSKILTRR